MQKGYPPILIAYRWIIRIIILFIHERFKAGESVTLKGFGSFYLRPERSTWVFKFTPGQRLRALFGWSSSYKGP